MFNLPLYILAEDELTEAAATHTFTLADYTIPSWAVHLVVLINGQVAGASERRLRLRFNADSGSNYGSQNLEAFGSSSAVRQLSATSMQIGYITHTEHVWGGGMFVIPEYANTARHKVCLALGGTGGLRGALALGRWADTEAITSITFLADSDPNFTVTSRFTLALVDERFSVRSETLGSDGTFDHLNIPALDDLAFIATLRTDRTEKFDEVSINVNNDTTDSNYARQLLDAHNSTAEASTASDRQGGIAQGSNAEANNYGLMVGSVNSFAKGNDDPHAVIVSGCISEVAAEHGYAMIASLRHNNVAAVTRFGLTPRTGTNFKAGSSLWLYRAPKPYLQRVVLTGTSALITFDNIPQDGDALVVTVYARSAEAAATDTLLLELEDDTTAGNYDVQYMRGDSTTVSGGQSGADRTVLVIPGDSAGADIWGGGMFIIPDYTSTARQKHIISVGGPSEDLTETRSIRWENTAAIDKLELTLGGASNFLANSIIELAVVKNLSFQNTTIKTRTRQT